MTNLYYNPSGNPVTLARGASSTIRSEYSSVAAGFDLLPTPALLFSDSANYAVDTGSVNAYAITVNSSIISVSTDGYAFRFKTDNANTAASTLNSVSIVRPDGSALIAGDIVAGINEVVYNSTLSKFTLVSLAGSASATAAAASASAASSSASDAAASAVVAASYAAGLTSTSTTSLTIGTGSKVFTTQSSKAYAAGQFFSAVSAANSANYMHGVVDSYVGTTLTGTVTNTGGSGTLADWNLSISGSRGATGAAGANSAMIYLSTVTASDVATADIETTFDSTYDYYVIKAVDVYTHTNNTTLRCLLKMAGTYQTANNYFYFLDNSNTGAPATFDGAGTSVNSSIEITKTTSNSSANSVVFEMQVVAPSSTVFRKKVFFSGICFGTTLKLTQGGGFWNGGSISDTLTGVRFKATTGNISGTFYLYGISKT